MNILRIITCIFFLAIGWCVSSAQESNAVHIVYLNRVIIQTNWVTIMQTNWITATRTNWITAVHTNTVTITNKVVQRVKAVVPQDSVPTEAGSPAPRERISPETKAWQEEHTWHPALIDVHGRHVKTDHVDDNGVVTRY